MHFLLLQFYQFVTVYSLYTQQCIDKKTFVNEQIVFVQLNSDKVVYLLFMTCEMIREVYSKLVRHSLFVVEKKIKRKRRRFSAAE